MQNEIRFEAMRRQRTRSFDEFLFFAFQHVIRDPALAVSMHQFIQRAPRLLRQQTRGQVERNALVQKLHDLRFLGSLDLVLFFMLQTVLQSVAHIVHRLPRHDFLSQRFVERRQFPLLNFGERDCVIRPLAG